MVCRNGRKAVQPRLEYLFSGPLPSSQPAGITSLHVSILSCTTEDATQRRFWDVESTGATHVMKTSDIDFLHEYRATKITVHSDGAYGL